jgi:hypothetical protein
MGDGTDQFPLTILHSFETQPAPACFNMSIMKTSANRKRLIPQHDYRAALQSAVSWLGERYVLAEPVRRRDEGRRGYFSTPRSWHPRPNH